MGERLIIPAEFHEALARVKMRAPVLRFGLEGFDIAGERAFQVTLQVMNAAEIHADFRDFPLLQRRLKLSPRTFEVAVHLAHQPEGVVKTLAGHAVPDQAVVVQKECGQSDSDSQRRRAKPFPAPEGFHE